MLILLRVGIVGGCAAALALTGAGLAFAHGAGGGTQCITGGDSCTVEVGAPGSSSTSSPASGNQGSGSKGGGQSNLSPSPSPTSTLTVPQACTYTADPTYVPPAGTDTHAGQKGGWYLVSCPDGLRGGLGFTSTNSDMWLTNPPPAPPSAQQLAAEATAELKLPVPGIGSSPVAGSPELVGVPVWVWASSSSWSSRSATASAGGVSVTATATPVSATWSFGDGSSITCDGPGTVYSPADEAQSSSPTCGHTYTQIGSFTLAATVTWKVTWAGAGETGVFNGMTTTAREPVTVEQSNAVVTG